MKSILYIQHVPWGWIKQRPHFLAEHLSRHFDVDVYCESGFRSRMLSGNQVAAHMKIHSLAQLPLRRFGLVRQLNWGLVKQQLSRSIETYDVVWLTHPSLFPYVQSILPDKTKLIYDCMDDALAFPAVLGDQRKRECMEKEERKLLDRSNLIIVSSEELKSTLTQRGADSSRLKLLFNAILYSPSEREQSMELPGYISRAFEITGTAIVYVGTISEWFDFPLVLEGLERYPGTTCLLFGPSEVRIPVHKRLLHMGPVEHQFVMPILKKADLLVMPFVPSRLVMSVDPVKLYEYVASGTTSVAIAYPGTEKFKEFVHLYKEPKEYFEILEQCCNGNMSSMSDPKSRRAFAEANTWTARGEKLIEWMTATA